MYIRRKAFSVAYDENGEEKLFSTTEIMSEEAYLEKLYSENEEQKEFNSKAQKLLRRASDYKKAMTGSGRLVSAGEAGQINKGMNTFGNNGESFIKQGREMNKSLKTRKTDINAKINRKAGLTSAV
jgi:hypothetical protein